MSSKTFVKTEDRRQKTTATSQRSQSQVSGSPPAFKRLKSDRLAEIGLVYNWFETYFLQFSNYALYLNFL